MRDKNAIWKVILPLLRKSAFAGLLIAIAGWIYLQAESKIIGAALFSVGLLAVFVSDANLFTGKIGYAKSGKDFSSGLVMLIVNALVAFTFGLLWAATQDGELSIMAAKLDKSPLRVLVDSAGCGALIYIACEAWKSLKNPLIPIICVMGFILAGFEHCIADAFYLGASGFSWKGLGFIGIVAAGNSIGALSTRVLQIGLPIKQ